MDNKDILKILKLTASLMELHDENSFAVSGLNAAVFSLDKLSDDLDKMSKTDLAAIKGVGNSSAEKVLEIVQTGTLAKLEKLLSETPSGVIEMMSIKGIGPKKVRAIWKELQIESIADLHEACVNNKVSELKGFGQKIQDQIIENIQYKKKQVGKVFFADIELLATEILNKLKPHFTKIEICGEVIRKMEVVEKISYLIQYQDIKTDTIFLDQLNFATKDLKKSGPFIWRGFLKEPYLAIEFLFVKAENFGSELYKNSASENHLSEIIPDQSYSVFQYLNKNKLSTEQEFFTAHDLDFIYPEMREGFQELHLAKDKKLPVLITDQDLKGSFHNHSTYSDGKHSVEQMAMWLKDRGYQYFGIADHSQSAGYAGGLYPEKVWQQFAEIDELNKKLAPFKIFKGIESDILGDGSLDYEDDLLSKFDYVVASIHSAMKMDIDKATARLIKAIENPYTTMLGHPTGRLLLNREGYPVDHKKIIDACAANKVIIEINSSPWRLDLDWRHIDYALQKGVILSLNPDAHEVDGHADMHYGVCVARKGGLSKDMTFNAFELEKVEEYFKMKKV